LDSSVTGWKMDENVESLIFSREIALLLREYENCHDSNLKYEIAQDIELLMKAISLSKNQDN
jgi:hypothetical protein